MAGNQVRTIVGTMVMGGQLQEAESHAILKECFRRGLYELDTAIMYCNGKTEKIIGNLPLCRDQSKVRISCKANPVKYGFLADQVVRQLNESLESLQTPSCDIFYLHWPDHGTAIEETLKGVDVLYREGKFQYFGLSNYKSWEVMEIYQICKANGYVLPKVYQGMYNAITREVEAELFPCLRRLGMRFYAYNALAGGILTGKHNFEEDLNKIQPGRFSGYSADKMYRGRYWKPSIFDAVEIIKAALKSAYDDKVNLMQASIRWLYYHSLLSGDHQDGVILGFSKLEHLNGNIEASEGGPLKEEVVAAFERAWALLGSQAATYWR